MILAEVFESNDVDLLSGKFEEWIDSGVSFGEILVSDEAEHIEMGIRMERWEVEEDKSEKYIAKRHSDGFYGTRE